MTDLARRKRPRAMAPWPKCETTGKTRFASEDAAKRGRRMRTGDPLRVYLCRHCLGWHLTSSKGETA